MMKHTLQEFLFPFINVATFIIVTFDSWMNKGALDTFTLVINFLILDWEPKHVTIGFLKQKEFMGLILLINCKFCLRSTNLLTISLAMDEDINLSTMTNVLKHIVTCEKLGMHAPFEDVCFGHALSKACQYATFDEKISFGLQLVSIKTTQSSVQSCIIWPKKSSEGRVKWTKACLAASLWPWKLNRLMKTRFASKVTTFQHALEFKVVIHVCYNLQTLVLQGKIPTSQVWAIVEVTASTLALVVSSYVFNQCCGYWLLTDALANVINFLCQIDPREASTKNLDELYPCISIWCKIALISK